MTNKNHEIIKQVILNDQLGNPKDLNIVVVKKTCLISIKSESNRLF